MAKGGKLTKIKSVLKKMQSFKLVRSTSNVSRTDSSASFESPAAAAKDLRPVYVGKSRRRYLISADVMENPLLRELIDRSSGGGDEEAVTIGCEVVLFEHLLWMLENADPQSESMFGLAEFYTC